MAADDLRGFLAALGQLDEPIVLRLDREPHPATRRLMDFLGVDVVVDQLRPSQDRGGPVSSIASRARTMGNFAVDVPAARDVAPPPEPELRELPSPPTDCAAGECVYERACPLDGRCVVRDRQEGEEMLERDGLDALDRMDRGESQQVNDAPARADDESPDDAASDAVVRRVPRGSKWTRERIIERFHAWAETHDGQAPKTYDWRLATDEWPTVDAVLKIFGKWRTGVEAAGLTVARRASTAAAVSPGRDVERLGPDGSRSDETTDAASTERERDREEAASADPPPATPDVGASVAVDDDQPAAVATARGPRSADLDHRLQILSIAELVAVGHIMQAVGTAVGGLDPA